MTQKRSAARGAGPPPCFRECSAGKKLLVLPVGFRFNVAALQCNSRRRDELEVKFFKALPQREVPLVLWKLPETKGSKLKPPGSARSAELGRILGTSTTY